MDLFSRQILGKILERGSPQLVASFHQMSGFHLLAVQIHRHPITQELAEACFRLFFHQPVSINQQYVFPVNVLVTRFFDLQSGAAEKGGGR